VIRSPPILLAIHTPLEATGISKIKSGAKPAEGWSVRHQKGEKPEVTAALLEIKKNNILNEIDRRALVSSEATARLIEAQAHSAVEIPHAAPLKTRELAIPIPNGRRGHAQEAQGSRASARFSNKRAFIGAWVRMDNGVRLVLVP
jgi:hypothetical protein